MQPHEESREKTASPLKQKEVKGIGTEPREKPDTPERHALDIEGSLATWAVGRVGGKNMGPAEVRI